MSTPIEIRPTSMVDPRGEFRRPPTPLAPRLPILEGKTVLLFDNTQLTTELPNFGPIFRWFSQFVEDKYHVRCSYDAKNLLRASKDEMSTFADGLARKGFDAIVIALCKGGITGPTSLFAAELEKRGMPCVQICTALGFPLAGVTASRYVPGLPIVLMPPATGDADSFGKNEADAIAPEIVAGLTTDPATLLGQFRVRFSSENLAIAKDGKLQLPSVDQNATEIAGKLTVDVDPGEFAVEFYDTLCAADMCDGFPVIPPTQARVEAMLRYTDLDAGEVLVAEIPPSGGAVTVRNLAANAVMAGCRPEYFPILVAAFQAIGDPAYRIIQGSITSHPSGNAVIVSGPLAEALGIQSGSGCLGPGFRANATIGRTITLTIMNVARAIPGKTDLSVHGSPAEYTYCFAEIEKNHPWQPLHSDLYGQETTSVTVHKCEGPHNVLDPRAGPEELLRTVAAVAATPGGNSLVHLGQLLVILNPRQATMIAKAGWSKRDVKEFLFETARHPVELARKQGKRASFPPYFLNLQNVPAMRSPDDVIVVVAGGTGGHAMVGVPWGRAKATSRPVVFRDGTPIRTLKSPLR